ncbi:hypothetical protein D3C81_1082010 [compost metagenome]
MRHGAAGFLDHILGGIARGMRLQHHMAQAGGQHAAQRGILFEIVHHLGRGLALLGGRQGLLVQAGRQHLAALEGEETFDDQREGNDRGEQQWPDRPAGRLNDGKHVDPRNLQNQQTRNGQRGTGAVPPMRGSLCCAPMDRRAAAMLEKCRRHSNPPLGARQDTRARAVSGAHRPAPGGLCGLCGLGGCLCGFPHWRGTVLWTGCGKLPEKRAKPLIGKGVRSVA